MGKGNTLAGEGKMKSPSFRIHTTKLEEFDRHIDAHDDWSSGSEAVRELIEEEIDGSTASRNGEHLPDDSDERRIYLAMLGAANENLIYSSRRHGNALKRQLGEGDLEAAAYLPLRRKGFISRQEAPPMKRNGNVPQHVYRVKPIETDPGQWRYREVVVQGGQQ